MSIIHQVSNYAWSIRITRVLFPRVQLRFAGDAGLDDQKIFRWVALVDGEFIIRAVAAETLRSLHSCPQSACREDDVGLVQDTAP